jgi:cation transport regulator ChaB
MPYTNESELPPFVKKLPSNLKRIWMSAFNAAYKEYNGDEGKSFATANAAVKKYRESHSAEVIEGDLDNNVQNFLKDEKVKPIDFKHKEDFKSKLDSFLRGK